MKDGFGQAFVVCGMPESCKFTSLDSCQKRSLWTHKAVDLAPHPVVGLVLQVGNAEKFPHAPGFEGPIFSQDHSEGSMFHSREEVGGDRRLVELELACGADGVAPQDPV